MKADAEWTAIEAKVLGRDTDYKASLTASKGTYRLQAVQKAASAAMAKCLHSIHNVVWHVLPGFGSVLLHCYYGE